MKTVLVTGGSRGIGFEIAKKCLQNDYKVIILARAKETLDQVCDSLSQYGDICGQTLDLANPEGVADFCAMFNQSLYGLVNNAGVCKTQYLRDSSNEEDCWENVISTNLFGPYYLTKGLIEHISFGGRIVNIASQLGKDGRRGYGAYCASKFALIGLTKCWAKELGEFGITVNAVCPGWVSTEMSKNDAARIAEEQNIPLESYYENITYPLELGRMNTPEEVANLVVFLLSQEASGISGRDWLMHTIWNQE